MARRVKMALMPQESVTGTGVVVGFQRKGLDGTAFETSVFAQFWREASTAVAFSRMGKVHRIRCVELDALKKLHAEATGGPAAPAMTIAVVGMDFESLAGPMLRRVSRQAEGWRMGDGSLVKFFSELPGPEEGRLVQARSINVSSETQRDLNALRDALEANARRVRQGS